LVANFIELNPERGIFRLSQSAGRAITDEGATFIALAGIIMGRSDNDIGIANAVDIARRNWMASALISCLSAVFTSSVTCKVPLPDGH
jgi:hypothetical protein